ncbi:hypothetical protein BGZ94_005124 [Podila epigama]|nr:hypothetical protein BGZ94_005124 [Podila epigama]
MLRNTASSGTHSRTIPTFGPKRRPGTHVVLLPRRHTAQGVTASSSRHLSSRSGSTGLWLHRHNAPQRIKINQASSSPCTRFSTSTIVSKKKKEVSAKPSTTSTSSRVEGEVIYRKEGSKIVPVAVKDQVAPPVSGLFTQFEEFAVKPSSSSSTSSEPRLAPSKGDTTQDVDLASLTLEDGSPLAFAMFKIASDNGDVIARYSYGTMLYRGTRGVPRDTVKGRAILQTLATPTKGPIKGLPWAQVTMGGICARDDQDFEAARDWYELASARGILEARIALGRMYLSGELPRDMARAKKYFQSVVASDALTASGPGGGKGADAYADAHFMLGVLETNESEKPNYKLAFQHFQRAASKGMAEAQYNVGQAYFRGLGVTKNDALADETPAEPSIKSDETTTTENEEEGSKTNERPTVTKHVWDPSKKDLLQAQKWFTLASRRPGHLGAEGQRLKAKVDEAIRRGGGASKDGRMCTIM